jgi:hypothetical protein
MHSRSKIKCAVTLLKALKVFRGKKTAQEIYGRERDFLIHSAFVAGNKWNASPLQYFIPKHIPKQLELDPTGAEFELARMTLRYSNPSSKFKKKMEHRSCNRLD